jgi:hypothetical protein
MAGNDPSFSDRILYCGRVNACPEEIIVIHSIVFQYLMLQLYDLQCDNGKDHVRQLYITLFYLFTITFRISVTSSRVTFSI